MRHFSFPVCMASIESEHQGDCTAHSHLHSPITRLCVMQLAFPDSIHMNRGNHEDDQINMKYGFLDEVQRKFGRGHMYQEFQVCELNKQIAMVWVACELLGRQQPLACCPARERSRGTQGNAGQNVGVRGAEWP